MLRRSRLAVLAVVLLAALAGPAPALALDVHVRVEGVSRTIFGASEPLVDVFEGSLANGDVTLDLTRPTALGALEGASTAGEFYFALTSTSFGPYVSQIGRVPAAESSGWVFKVNGASPPVGADAYTVKAGDRVLWYYATFTDAGGPPTLDLVRDGSRCFRTFSVNDAGDRTRATDVVYRLGSRTIRSANGRICPRGSWSTLRATTKGAIRSQVVTRG